MSSSFTKTETAILQLLSDGQPHTRREIHGCLPDELAALKAINPHITRIRQKLLTIGHDLLCVLRQRTICYQHVRLLTAEAALERL